MVNMLSKSSKKKFTNAVISEAINILLKQAEENFESHSDRAKRYVGMLWALVKRYKIRLTKEQKLKFCRKCLRLLHVNKNSKIIFNNKNNSFYIHCFNCNSKRRI